MSNTDSESSSSESSSSESSCSESSSSESSDDDSEYLPKGNSDDNSDNSQLNYNLRSNSRKRTHTDNNKLDTKKKQKLLPEPPFRVNNWNDLVKLTSYSLSKQYKDCFELPKLYNIISRIDNLIGLHELKNSLVYHILYHCQLYKFEGSVARMNHIVLMGPPGCGKTTMAHLIAELFCLLAVVKKNKIVVGTRKNMIGSFVGQTAKCTQEVIDRAIGGVLLIDEAYALGDGRSADSGDSFSKSCVDTLNQNLSEKAGEFLCILVGYKDSLYRDFFSINPGLERRFPWKYEIKPYTKDELVKIFKIKCHEKNLIIKKDINLMLFFQLHYGKFAHFAASIHEFIEKIELVLCKLSFGRAQLQIINNMVLNNTIEQYKTKDDNKNTIISSMYI